MLRNRKAGCGLLAVATLLLLTLGGGTTASQGAQPGVSYFVAPDGDDAAEGSQRAPFATLERARDAVRALKRTSGLPPGGVSVYLRGGSHRLLRTFALGPQDSGTEGAPITYGAYRGEEVRLVGGADLDPEAFRPVADAEVLRRLPRGARGEVFAIDLRAQGLTDYGELRPYGKIHDAVDDPNIKPPVPVPPELFFNGTSLTLARWPNEGFATVGTVIDPGSVPRDGDPGNRGGTFMYGGERPSRWTDAEDLWLYGFWQYDWADAALKVATIDPERRRITLAMASHYGLRSGGRFYAFNLLEELDAPGEWYLDRRAGILYLYPPGPLADATVQLSTLEGPMVSLTNTSHVSLRGLTFEVGRGSGVAIRGGSSNLVADSTLRLLGEKGVVIRGGEWHGVTGSEVYATGAGGIVLAGGDRATLRPAGHVALNNHLHDYARIQRTYSPAVSLSGVGNRAAHNLIHDAPHLAIGLSGNDHMIEFNEIYEVVQETADAGAIYMGRDWTARGNVIRYNFIHDIPYEDTQGVYLDDVASGTTVFGNVFYRLEQAVFIGGGRDNVVENNLFIGCNASVRLDARGLSWSAEQIAEGGGWQMYEKLAAVPYRSAPWRARYPRLAKLLEDEPAVPKYNVVRNNVLYNTPSPDLAPEARQHGTVQHNLKARADPGFVAPDALNFALKDDAWVYRELPGLEPIPFEQIGPQPQPRATVH